MTQAWARAQTYNTVHMEIDMDVEIGVDTNMNLGIDTANL